MNKQDSIAENLDMLARLAARLTASPVATITIYDRDCADDGDVQTIAHNATALDKAWQAANQDVDISQLGSPRTAVAQHLGLYAAVPMRNGDGSTIGMIACADDDDRELSAEQLESLKHIAALASAVSHN